MVRWGSTARTAVGGIKEAMMINEFAGLWRYAIKEAETPREVVLATVFVASLVMLAAVTWVAAGLAQVIEEGDDG